MDGLHHLLISLCFPMLVYSIDYTKISEDLEFQIEFEAVSKTLTPSCLKHSTMLQKGFIVELSRRDLCKGLKSKVGKDSIMKYCIEDDYDKIIRLACNGIIDPKISEDIDFQSKWESMVETLSPNCQDHSKVILSLDHPERSQTTVMELCHELSAKKGKAAIMKRCVESDYDKILVLACADPSESMITDKEFVAKWHKLVPKLSPPCQIKAGKIAHGVMQQQTQENACNGIGTDESKENVLEDCTIEDYNHIEALLCSGTNYKSLSVVMVLCCILVHLALRWRNDLS